MARKYIILIYYQKVKESDNSDYWI